DGGKADNTWEIPGLKTAVHVDGTLNDPRDTDQGWTVEIAMPWVVLGKLAASDTLTRSVSEGPLARTEDPLSRFGLVSAPPRDGDQWRVNFSRVEWRHRITSDGKYEKVPNRREDNWVWSPQWTVNMHRPETWGYVQFSTAAPGSDAALAVKLHPDPAGPVRHLIHQIYYAQHVFGKKHERFAKTLGDLGLDNLAQEMIGGPPVIETTEDRFDITAEM
ncbi:MAG: carbohydrate-binding family 9-like protein, partial [Planctomycetes bacterium]|nr:carbohydrate-binding family 9-like protein [Planctomycetota bacterium]